ISTTFQPSEFADTILISSDGVVFFVLAGQLTSHSENAFAGLLSATTSPRPAALPEVYHVEQTAAVLNVVLHALHGLVLTLYNPDLVTLYAAVDALLVQYAVPPKLVLCPATPLFDALLAHAQSKPLEPLDVYAFAAKHNMEDLAIASSALLLSFPIDTLSDADAERIGTKYLRKLFCLHMARVSALHQLLLAMPVPHAASPYCTVADAEAMKSAWMLAAARLNLEARPDHTSHSLQATLSPVLVKVWCKDCRKALQTRIDALIADWVAVKV
ncbi:hypothetical protein EXIGLDRAFT_579335, partial [Exidia glandulosa HHB12029]